MARTIFVVAMFIFGGSLSCYPASEKMKFQGAWFDDSLNPKSDADVPVMFRLYDLPTGGTVQWFESKTVQRRSGYFSTELNTLNPSVFSFDNERYLSIDVNNSGEMLPRTQIMAVPYVFSAQKARSIEGVVSTLYHPADKTPVVSVNGSNQVGIGTTTPAAGTALDIEGSLMTVGPIHLPYTTVDAGTGFASVNLNFSTNQVIYVHMDSSPTSITVIFPATPPSGPCDLYLIFLNSTALQQPPISIQPHSQVYFPSGDVITTPMPGEFLILRIFYNGTHYLVYPL